MEKLQPLLELIKPFIPKFHNKLTWLVVISGLGLTSTSILERIINVIFQVNYGITITEKSDGYVGMALVGLGLFYNLLALRFSSTNSSPQLNDKEASIKEHDKKLFTKVDTELSERHLNTLLESLGSDHSYRSSTIRPYYALSHFAEITENKYINKETISKFDAFMACTRFT